MFQNLTGWHALIVLAIVLLIFGAAKLPALARSLGQSVRILKQESADAADEPTPPTTAVPVAASVPPAATVAAPASTPTSP